jgi:CO dehydrogenase maturation factor
MSTIIAVTGKGGVGKTMLSASIVRWLVGNKKSPVLAVDADSNANLHEMLGVAYTATVGGVREDARSAAAQNTGIAKQQFLELRIEQALVECPGFDLIVMGRGEGPGCYCYANNVLRDVLAKLSSSYPYVVIDCEAGLEHISRRTIFSIDWLLTVSDPTVRGLETAVRVGQLLDEMKTRVSARGLIVNKVRQDGQTLTARQQTVIAAGQFSPVLTVPYDETVAAMDENGGCVNDLPDQSSMQQAVDAMMRKILE